MVVMLSKKTAVLGLFVGVLALSAPASSVLAEEVDIPEPAESEDVFGADKEDDIDVMDINDEFDDNDGDNAAAAGAADEQPQVSAEEVERLQKLFSQLSEECNEQVRLAYTEGKELSDDCKEEVQTIMRRENANAKAGNAVDPAQNSDKSDPTFTILGFVVLLLAGLVAWGVYAQRTIIDQMPETKPKKLSKQKQLKLKMKEQKRAGPNIQ
ncbi:Hypothetical Protein FCC1311_085582 [Hondaea fermentalgiana]|uniref:Uncharacterized protein n=1 Tax=Hondaea fermentalgiana TaxID=2315210 RepID=A0A2R5GUJ6_9STRA|nr:Hypothetical Protein FCC1311_085582 [Hondaea fermentalgiana]|eukprot:GBG32333.1 Hypothetical Protein FCC1311_085582 [Hondaea fermentalgiana]